MTKAQWKALGLFPEHYGTKFVRFDVRRHKDTFYVCGYLTIRPISIGTFKSDEEASRVAVTLRLALS